MTDPYVYEYGTDPFRHQDEIFLRTRDELAWGLLMEMGTGKSKVAEDTAAYLYERKLIDAVLIIAPNMVHRNWITDEIPRHVPKRLKLITIDWHSKRAKHRDQLRRQRQILDEYNTAMPWVAISYDAIMTDAGHKFLRAYLARYPRFMLIVDESTRCKTPSAKRTRRVQAIANLATYKRILTGTPVTNGPFDIYSQIKLLDEQFWWRHGLGTYAAFTSRFGVFKTIEVSSGVALAKRPISRPESIVLAGKAEVAAYDLATAEAFEQIDPEALEAFLDASDPLYQPTADVIAELQAAGAPGMDPDLAAETYASTAQKTRSVRVRVAFKDVERIHDMIAPIVSRVTKEDAGLNLPPKLYNRICIHLAPDQRKAYDRMKSEFMLELDGGKLITAPIAMVRLLRLHQIACGYLPDPGGGEDPIMMMPNGEEPRLNALMDLIEDVPHKAIIWARFRVDIDRICAALGKRCVRIDGAVPNPTARVEAVARFRDPRGAQFFVANPAAIAMGITLTEARTVIYFSNSFSLEQREQSEDRAHRIGQEYPVLYYDLIAENTVDERIVQSLRTKKAIAAQVTGDAIKEWLV